MEQVKQGRVTEVRKNSFIVEHEGREYPARLRGSFYEGEAEDWPVVGDRVTFLPNPAGEAVIQAVLERKSFLKRPDQAKTGVMQYMAANADYCFIITALNEDYSYNRIARYASLILQGGAVPVAVLTKADLCPHPEGYVREVRGISPHIRVHAVSALTGTGLEELWEYLAPGRTVCLLGSSGAGKSTLINTLAGEELMKTGAVRESDSTGKHTTTHRQLFRLKNGACVIDTPGMREVGMAQAGEGIDRTFSDIRELEGRCRFSDCKHDTEPGCAVKAAIAAGTLSEERFRLYRSLGRENRNNYAKKKAIAKLAKARKDKRGYGE